jgi:hypothetical protein
MKSQIVKVRAAKISVLRNLALPIFALLALTGAAYAQGAGSDLKAKDAADAKAAREYMDRMETDQKYQEAIHNQQAAPTSNDPWGVVRPATTPPATGAKPAAKTATGTKTASGANKAVAGSIKPAPGPAASATSATPKGQ